MAKAETDIRNLFLISINRDTNQGKVSSPLCRPKSNCCDKESVMNRAMEISIHSRQLQDPMHGVVICRSQLGVKLFSHASMSRKNA
jgi:hypothetical protein